MKKILLVVAMVAMVSGSAFAQKGKKYIGSSVQFAGGNEEGIPSTGIIVTKDGDLTTTSFGIAPEFGYYVSDKVALGINAGFNYTTFKIKNVSGTENFTSWAVNPYVRYFAVSADKFSLYFQGDVAYGSIKPNGGDSEDTFFVGVRPGIKYDFSNCFSLYTSFGELGYTDYGKDNNRFGLNVDMATLRFGLIFNF